LYQASQEQSLKAFDGKTHYGDGYGCQQHCQQENRYYNVKRQVLLYHDETRIFKFWNIEN
jgi:hypothetical protein